MVVSPSSGAGLEMIAAAMKWWHRVVAGIACLFLGGAPRVAMGQAPPRTFVLIVTGASGEPRFATGFHAQAMALRVSATTKLGIPDSLMTYLAENPAVDPTNIKGKSTREGVAQAIDAIAARAKPADNVMILLLGHGSSQNDESRFSMPGPDLTAAEFAKLLDRLSGQTVAFIDASSASGEFIK